MVNYNCGKIYKITSPNTTDIYVGSTTMKLSDRFNNHKATFKCSSRKILDYGEPQIELIENFPCNSKKELNEREGYFIKTLNTVNKCIAGRTIKEYRQDNHERIRENDREYKVNHREEAKEYNKLYREHNKDKKYYCEICDCYVVRTNKSYHLKSKKHINNIVL